ncbi:uncharacterized protein PHA67_018118 isoform 1-T1 [Liasis olivaceus]
MQGGSPRLPTTRSTALNKWYLPPALEVPGVAAPPQSCDCDSSTWQPAHTYNGCSIPQSCDHHLQPIHKQSQWGSWHGRSQVALPTEVEGFLLDLELLKFCISGLSMSPYSKQLQA